MGKEKVKQALQQKQQDDFTKTVNDIFKTSVSIRSRFNKLTSNLRSLLREEYTFTDKNGKTITVAGGQTSAEQQKKGIYGTLDVFSTPEYNGHPFEEVSRNMESHFKTYCLVNGISREEMLSLADGEMTPKTHAALTKLKKDFFAMVANKDMEAIENYYAGIANYFADMLPELMQCDDIRNIPKNEDNFLLFTGTASYLEQTLRLNGYSDTTEDQKSVIENVNKKLQAQGKFYTLNSVEKTLFPFDMYASALLSDLKQKYMPKDNMDYSYLTTEGLNPAADDILNCVIKLPKIISKVKSQAVEQGIDYNKNFIDADGMALWHDIQTAETLEEKDTAFKEQFSSFNLNDTDAFENATLLETNLAVIADTKASKEITELLNAVSKIKSFEQKIKQDPDSMNLTDYEKLAALYVSVDESSKSIIESDKTDFSDEEYSAAFTCREFAKRGMQGPHVGAIISSKAKALEMLKASAPVSKDSSAIFKRLSAILQEPFEHTDKNGTVRKINGFEDDPKAGTLGIHSIFESKEFKGKPFNEASRNMFSHFQMYCLTQGLTEKELVSLKEAEINKDLKDKLLKMKGDFFDMIINKDLDKISDMYAKIGEMIYQDKDRFLNLTPVNPQPFKNDAALFLKYAGSQSWLEQTFNHGQSNETPETKEMISKVEEKWAAKGLNIKFNNLSVPVSIIDSTLQSGERVDPSKISMKDMAANGRGYREIMLQEPLKLVMQEDLAKNKDGNWLKAFSDNPYEQNEKYAKKAEDYLTPEKFVINLLKTTGKNSITAKYEYKLAHPEEKAAEKPSIDDKKRAKLEQYVLKAKIKLLKSPDNPDPAVLKSFVAANEYLKHPEKFPEIKGFDSMGGSIDKDAILEAYGNLSKNEKIAMISGSNMNSAYESFIDDYEYIFEKNAMAQVTAEADAEEEKRALLDYYKQPAKNAYVNAQMKLGRILTGYGKLDTYFKTDLMESLSSIVAAKQMEDFIEKNADNLSEAQIKELTSENTISKCAEQLLQSKTIQKMADVFMEKGPEEIAKIAIGAEKLFDKNEEITHGSTERSNQMAASLTDLYEKLDNLEKAASKTAAQPVKKNADKELSM